MFPAKQQVEYSDIENRIRSLTLNSGNEYAVHHSSVHKDTSECLISIDPENGEKLQQEKLRSILEQLQKEREDNTFSRTCLFCKKHFTGNRSALLSHLMEQHNFFIGAPDNIVFVNDLLDKLENMLSSLQCFYCEKIFKDWLTLKEHMRKKQHKRISPCNKFFDKFYLINYLKQGKSWIDIQQEDDGLSQDSDEKEMDVEWQDENSAYFCLFCNHSLIDFEEILQHMKNDHKFDFKDLKKKHNLNFYSQIKLINYIRRKVIALCSVLSLQSAIKHVLSCMFGLCWSVMVYDKECTICDSKFDFHGDLIKHMAESGHISVFPDQANWDQSMFYFSTFENDNFLCALDVDESDCNDENLVYPEDPVLPTSTILSDENIRKNLL